MMIQSLLLVAATVFLSVLAVPLVAAGQTAPTPKGRWIPDNMLGVIHIVDTTPNTTAPTAPRRLHLFSYFSTTPNRWAEAKATFLPSQNLINVTEIRMYRYRHNNSEVNASGDDTTWFPTCWTGDVSTSTSYPQIRWNGGCPSEWNPKSWTNQSQVILQAFKDGAVWHLYGSDIVCRQDHPMMMAKAKAFAEAEAPVDDKHLSHAHGDHPVFQGNDVRASTRTGDDITNHALQKAQHQRLNRADGGHLQQTEVGAKRIHGAGNVTKVHVVFTQHFDLGYTDYLYCVLDHYIWYILPGVALTATELGDYKYTTHPFILYTVFNCAELQPAMRPPPGIEFYCPSPPLMALLTAAVQAKQIVWHAFPFDGFNEMLGQTLFDFSFNYAAWLTNNFFPNETMPTGIQQVDVPGLYQVQVRRMKENGVRGIYVGQNSQPIWAGALVTMPTLFQWNPLGDANSTDPLLVMVHHLGYGGISLSDAVIDTASGTALVVMCSLENRPSYTPEDIQSYLTRIAGEFPNAQNITPSTYDDFIDDVMRFGWPRSDLPTFNLDIGDTWVRSSSGDPVKVKKMMKYRRGFEACLANPSSCGNPTNQTLLNAAYFIISGCEHNWGLPMSPSDWEAAVVSNEEKREMVVSAEYFINGLGALGEQQTIQTPADRKGETIPLHRDDFAELLSQSPTSIPAENRTFLCPFSSSDTVTVRIGEDASIDYLSHYAFTWNGGEIFLNLTSAGPDNKLMSVVYAVHNTNSPTWGDPNPKMVLLEAHPTLVSVQGEYTSQGECIITAKATLNQSFFNTNSGKFVDGKAPLNPNDATNGNPIELANTTLFLELKYNIRLGGPPGQTTSHVKLHAELQVLNLELTDVNSIYHAYYNDNDIGDAFFVQFNPLIAECDFPAAYKTAASATEPKLEFGPPCPGTLFPGAWTLSALGQDYDPTHFHVNGTCQYHVVDSAAYISPFFLDSNLTVHVTSPDAQLVMFGWNNGQWQSKPNAAGDRCQPDTSTGLWYNLWNLWNGNWCVGFPWRREDGFTSPLSFRFDLVLP